MKQKQIIRICGLILIAIGLGSIAGKIANYPEALTLSYVTDIMKGAVMMLIGLILMFDIYKVFIQKVKNK